MNEALLNAALSLLSLLAVAATYGISKLAVKAKAETQKIQNEDDRKQVEDAIDDVDELTTKTVATFEQTTAKDLRAAVKAGTTGKDQLEALAVQALKEITNQTKPEVQELLEEHFGSFEDYVKKCIETKVLQIKATEA